MAASLRSSLTSANSRKNKLSLRCRNSHGRCGILGGKFVQRFLGPHRGGLGKTEFECSPKRDRISRRCRYGRSLPAIPEVCLGSSCPVSDCCRALPKTGADRSSRALRSKAGAKPDLTQECRGGQGVATRRHAKERTGDVGLTDLQARLRRQLGDQGRHALADRPLRLEQRQGHRRRRAVRRARGGRGRVVLRPPDRRAGLLGDPRRRPAQGDHLPGRGGPDRAHPVGTRAARGLTPPPRPLRESRR